jgi:sarcosine oxidase
MARVPRYDVVVVGGGAMGAATAHALATRGARVAMVEQFTAGHDRGSSHGPSRIFRLAYADASYVPFAQRALELWRRLSDECGVAFLETTGGIDHGPRDILEAVAAGLAANGATSQLLPAGEAMERWRGMRFDSSVLWQPDAGRLDADPTVLALHRRAAELGADIFTSAPVTDVRPHDDGVEVVTADRTVLGDVAVVAAGAWLPGLAARIGLADELPPLVVTQEQPAYFTAPAANSWPVFVHHGDRPHYGLFTPGVGVKVGEHGTGVVVDPDARVPADEARLRRLTSYVEQWLPGAEPTPTRVDTCLYTTTPDEAFVLRRSGRMVICSACSGHGFKFVPAVGERAAVLALRR